jgi:uncharacterized protein
MDYGEGPTRDGHPCWLDLGAPDAVGAAAFYEAVFGWSYEKGGPEYGNYHMALLGGRPVAGIGQAPEGEHSPASWTLYFSAEDADVRAEHARALGGAPVSDAMDIPGQGRLAILQDPTGAHFGLWQPGGHAGFGVVDVHGALAWCELLTRDPVAAEDFYTKLLGLDGWFVEGAANRYRALGREGEAFAGILQMAVEHEGVPPHWLAYFRVDDAERAAAAVRSGGGSVTDGPYDAATGRVIKATDPFGAAFAMVERDTA